MNCVAVLHRAVAPSSIPAAPASGFQRELRAARVALAMFSLCYIGDCMGSFYLGFDRSYRISSHRFESGVGERHRNPVDAGKAGQHTAEFVVTMHRQRTSVKPL